MQYKLIKDKNPIMRSKSYDVSLPLSAEDRSTLNFMLNYLRKSHDEKYREKHNVREGVGLAAIQIAIPKRMFAISYEDNEGNPIEYQLVNPTIIETSAKKCALESGEGCLSVDDDHEGLSHRYYSIKMKAFDALTNQEIVINAKGYDAIVLQHEYDHLEGIFYYDRINKFAPNQALTGEIIL